MLCFLLETVAFGSLPWAFGDQVISRDDEVLDELKKIVRLLSVIATHGLRQSEQIASLARVGFPPKQIAELLGTTANTVSVYLSVIRRRSKRGG
jgi:DNA-binding NarL/FixJ family response regulator